MAVSPDLLLLFLTCDWPSRRLLSYPHASLGMWPQVNIMYVLAGIFCFPKQIEIQFLDISPPYPRARAEVNTSLSYRHCHHERYPVDAIIGWTLLNYLLHVELVDVRGLRKASHAQRLL